MDHVVESQQFDRDIIDALFAIADSQSPSSIDTLRGKVMASLFFEPSTRTRFSFESAMLRLGGGVISSENAAEFSSAAKGETIEDTIRVMQHYADVIVLRHFEEGASKRAAAVSNVPVINAGDGKGQHPTQALLDVYTIKKELGQVDGKHIALIGDLKNGRTVRSLSYLLGKYDGITISFIAPQGLRIGNDIKAYLDAQGTAWEELESWDGTLSHADVVYQTRIQRERFTDPREYDSFKGKYVLTNTEVAAMKEHAIIMHPLPRVDEIAVEVDASQKAAYFRQATYGVLIRMALLQFLLKD